MTDFIPFNISHINKQDEESVLSALRSKSLVGDGSFTKKCHSFFESKLGIKRALLTSSCTDALEMCAILLNIGPGDEVIIPSYTFVSTANAFALHGASIKFCDSLADHPNINPDLIEPLITPKTKAIVVVHYAGHGCDMNKIMKIAEKHKLTVIEDAAQGIDSYYNGKPLGTIGHLGAMSFHGTKNIISGEGGLLLVNDAKFVHRAEVIREKGTNRSAFIRGEVDKYTWVDVGSSFLASELQASLLYSQLTRISEIQTARLKIFNRYRAGLARLQEKGIMLPTLPNGATENAHLFYLVCKNLEQRTKFFEFLKDHRIQAATHYISLHTSPYFKNKHDGRIIAHADRYTECLIRLPLYPDLSESSQNKIIQSTLEFFQ